jgi:hypothetical protein
MLPHCTMHLPKRPLPRGSGGWDYYQSTLLSSRPLRLVIEMRGQSRRPVEPDYRGRNGAGSAEQPRYALGKRSVFSRRIPYVEVNPDESLHYLVRSTRHVSLHPYTDRWPGR